MAIHVARGASTLGVFSEDEVREGLRSGRFMSSDLGWREGMANWQPLAQFSEFAADIGAATAAARPPPATPPPLTSTITPSPAGPAPEMPPPRGGLPWDARRERGFFNAFIETLQLVLSRPTEAFTAMRREGGLGEPLLYAMIGGTFGAVVASLYRFVFRSFLFGAFSTHYRPFEPFFTGFGLLIGLVLTPLAVLIGVFIGAAIFHVCLMIVGGANRTFEATFRVVCFALGSVYPLLVIPFCGGLIVLVWSIVLYSVGLARAHETDTGRAVLAVFLPLIVCCGGLVLLAVMAGGIGALVHHTGG
jgi:hypothetical protein